MISNVRPILVDPRHIKAILGLIQRMPLTEAEAVLTEDIFGDWFNQLNTSNASDTPADVNAPPDPAGTVPPDAPAVDPPLDTADAAPAPADPASAEHAYAANVDYNEFMRP